jgi:hypothetical protein
MIEHLCSAMSNLSNRAASARWAGDAINTETRLIGHWRPKQLEGCLHSIMQNLVQYPGHNLHKPSCHSAIGAGGAEMQAEPLA